MVSAFNISVYTNAAAVPPITLANVIVSAAPGNEYTATLVPEGSGYRMALDRDGDDYFDATEIQVGTSPADPAVYPAESTAVEAPDTIGVTEPIVVAQE